MATIQQAVQVMVDKLVADMNGTTPLSAEEQTLVSNAITRLTDNAKLEQAVVAVAQEHLDESTQLLQQVATSALHNIDTAKAELGGATAELVTRAAKLALLDQIAPLAQQISTAVNQANAAAPKTLFANKLIDTPSTSTNNRRATAVLAIYDSSGKSYLTRPSYTVNSANDACRLEHVEVTETGSGVNRIKTSFVYNNAFEQNPTTKVYQYGASALVPLGLKDQPNDIEYQVVFSTQKSQSTNVTEYGGIFVSEQGFTSRTLPKKDLNAVDQFGIATRTSHQHHDVAVLYNNQKHCLVVIDAGTNLVVEKYRDGNHITNIAIANSNEYQAYVDSGDFTTLAFIANTLAQPKGRIKYEVNEHSISSYALDYYGFFGVFAGETKIAGNSYSAHYVFTAEGKLAPINYHFTSNGNPERYPDTNGSVNSEGEVMVALESVNGEVLGTYRYRVTTDRLGRHGGIVATAIQVMNPYSQIGIIDEAVAYNTQNQQIYGLARTCRAI